MNDADECIPNFDGHPKIRIRIWITFVSNFGSAEVDTGIALTSDGVLLIKDVLSVIESANLRKHYTSVLSKMVSVIFAVLEVSF